MKQPASPFCPTTSLPVEEREIEGGLLLGGHGGSGEIQGGSRRPPTPTFTKHFWNVL